MVWEAFDRRYHIPVANSYGLSETIVIGSGTTTLPEYPNLTMNYQSVGVAVGYIQKLQSSIQIIRKKNSPLVREVKLHFVAHQSRKVTGICRLQLQQYSGQDGGS